MHLSCTLQPLSAAGFTSSPIPQAQTSADAAKMHPLPLILPNSSWGQLPLYFLESVGDWHGRTPALGPISIARQLFCSLCMGRGSGSSLSCSQNGNCPSGALMKRIPTSALSQNKGSVSSGIRAQISPLFNVGGPEVRAGDVVLTTAQRLHNRSAGMD